MGVVIIQIINAYVGGQYMAVERLDRPRTQVDLEE